MKQLKHLTPLHQERNLCQISFNTMWKFWELFLNANWETSPQTWGSTNLFGCHSTLAMNLKYEVQQYIFHFCPTKYMMVFGVSYQSVSVPRKFLLRNKLSTICMSDIDTLMVSYLARITVLKYHLAAIGTKEKDEKLRFVNIWGCNSIEINIYHRWHLFINFYVIFGWS